MRFAGLLAMAFGQVRLQPGNGIRIDHARLEDELGVPVIEKSLTRYDIFTADECFLTGTAAEVIPVVALDRRIIGTGKPGPVTRRIQDLFFGLFDGATPDKHGWLEKV